MMELLRAYAQHTFIPSDEFLFDAADDIIYYSEPELETVQGKIALLHEVAHAELHHFDYSTDLELVVMESRAWQKTRRLALHHELSLDESYIADCLDSYTHWLMERAECPHCQNFSLQSQTGLYSCFRCRLQWRVTTDTLNRVRQEKVIPKTHKHLAP